MTVAELIRDLSAQPQDAVVVLYQDPYYEEIAVVEVVTFTLNRSDIRIHTARDIVPDAGITQAVLLS